MEMFDILVCHGPNDDSLLDLNIRYNSANIVDRNNIYVITHDKHLKRSDCLVFHESIFPFSVEDIKKETSETRYGWYLQQLIKLYAHNVIPSLSEYYLVIDCDTIFLKPTVFFEEGVPLYNTGSEYHIPYFEHLSRVHSTFTKQVKESGICHHMMFNKIILKELFLLVETDYNKNKSEKISFWKILLICIDKLHVQYSGFSEYEMYFNYILKFHRDKMMIRQLYWKNTTTLNLISSDNNLNYVSYHFYGRR